ncbi:MAG: hypothetical protein LBI81_03650 [Puniceicoccales bacterium]|jgi:hypothetical protein|nr:hypothetical protein [Puniceicoccales bacterium]
MPAMLSPNATPGPIFNCFLLVFFGENGTIIFAMPTVTPKETTSGLQNSSKENISFLGHVLQFFKGLISKIFSPETSSGEKVPNTKLDDRTRETPSNYDELVEGMADDLENMLSKPEDSQSEKTIRELLVAYGPKNNLATAVVNKLVARKEFKDEILQNFNKSAEAALKNLTKSINDEAYELQKAIGEVLDQIDDLKNEIENGKANASSSNQEKKIRKLEIELHKLSVKKSTKDASLFLLMYLMGESKVDLNANRLEKFEILELFKSNQEKFEKSVASELANALKLKIEIYSEKSDSSQEKETLKKLDNIHDKTRDIPVTCAEKWATELIKSKLKEKIAQIPQG